MKTPEPPVPEYTVYSQEISQDDHRLGRHILHDSRSRNFALAPTIDKSNWRDKSVRIYDPLPNPNQEIGNCTMCAKAMQLNAVGNRKKGVVLNMRWATDGYHLVTQIDPFEGEWPPDDTGSSGLASAKAAQQLGEGGEYNWLFRGADEVVAAIMAGDAVSVGTWWYWDMFNPDRNKNNLVVPGGGKAGGHQWIARGYDVDRDEVIGRCWWGLFKDFRISRAHLDALLADDGDAHVQKRAL